MIKCKNCGHDSHCGIALTKTIDQVISGGNDTQIEVCKSCRCDTCTPKTDWG